MVRCASVSYFTLTLSLVLFALGCEDELGFSTGTMEVFTGDVIDAEFLTERPSVAEHILAPGTTMELRLNMGTLETDPGVVHTSDGLFDNEELVMLPEITCDRLSAFEVPGNFLRSLIFLAPTAEPELNGTDAVLFVSLAQDDKVEVRVLAGAGDRRRAFGVFNLMREQLENEEE